MKAVIHFSTFNEDVVRKAFNNMQNLIEHDPDADVACVVNSEAVKILRADSTFMEETLELADQGVTFKVCKNSIDRVDGMTVESFSDRVDVVDTGVGAVARLQDEGYAYIRP